MTFDTVSVIGNQVVDSSGTFLGTRAFGGGLSTDGAANVTIVNSTFANNIVHSNAGGGAGGGASLASNNSVTITNSTFTNNRAEGPTSDAFGGGLFIGANAQPFLITHATIAFNVAAFTAGGLASDTTEPCATRSSRTTTPWPSPRRFRTSVPPPSSTAGA